MYYLYQKLKSEDVTQYSFLNKVPLFGCNKGYVPQMLKRQLKEDSSEPLQWHVNIESGLREKGQDNQTLIIDLKPKSQSFSFYEILNVWGYSANGWTRVMLHLNGLFIDDDRGRHNEKDFTRTAADVDGPIFTMMYRNYPLHVRQFPLPVRHLRRQESNTLRRTTSSFRAPFVIPAKHAPVWSWAGGRNPVNKTTHYKELFAYWIPACAGMTDGGANDADRAG